MRSRTSKIRLPKKSWNVSSVKKHIELFLWSWLFCVPNTCRFRDYALTAGTMNGSSGETKPSYITELAIATHLAVQPPSTKMRQNIFTALSRVQTNLKQAIALIERK